MNDDATTDVTADEPRVEEGMPGAGRFRPDPASEPGPDEAVWPAPIAPVVGGAAWA